MANRTSTSRPSAESGSGYRKLSAKLPARRQAGTREGQTRLTPEERQRIIAETAYFIAERRGFSAGAELDDWLQAEAEVDRGFGGSGPS